MPIDPKKLREDHDKLSQAAPPPDPGADQRRALQSARGALNAEALPPGKEPEGNPVDDALHDGRAAGGRGSDAAMEAYANRVFAAAAEGDPRVSSQGVVTSETRDQWMEDAHHRQIANRDNSGMTQR